MFELEPGPLAPLVPDELRPFPPRSSFETLVADALGALAGAEAALASTAVRTTEQPPDDLDALYGATVGAAEAAVDDEIAHAPGSSAPTLVDTGNTVDQIRQSVLGYLPQPDAPISASFDEPPMLPEAIEEARRRRPYAD